jgi:hypothetical protein
MPRSTGLDLAEQATEWDPDLTVVLYRRRCPRKPRGSARNVGEPFGLHKPRLNEIV